MLTPSLVFVYRVCGFMAEVSAIRRSEATKVGRVVGLEAGRSENLEQRVFEEAFDLGEELGALGAVGDAVIG